MLEAIQKKKKEMEEAKAKKEAEAKSPAQPESGSSTSKPNQAATSTVPKSGGGKPTYANPAEEFAAKLKLKAEAAASSVVTETHSNEETSAEASSTVPPIAGPTVVVKKEAKAENPVPSAASPAALPPDATSVRKVLDFSSPRPSAVTTVVNGDAPVSGKEKSKHKKKKDKAESATAELSVTNGDGSSATSSGRKHKHKKGSSKKEKAASVYQRAPALLNPEQLIAGATGDQLFDEDKDDSDTNGATPPAKPASITAESARTPAAAPVVATAAESGDSADHKTDVDTPETQSGNGTARAPKRQLDPIRQAITDKNIKGLEQQLQDLDLTRKENKALVCQLLSEVLTNPSKKCFEIAKVIISRCLAAGFNIVQQPSVIQIDKPTLGMVSSTSKIWASFLHLAFLHGQYDVAKMLYQLGHKPLSEAALKDLLFSNHTTVVTAQGMRLALYYQAPLSKPLVEAIVSEIMKRDNPKFGDTAIKRKTVIPELTLDLLRYGTEHFAHGFFGGTSRLQKFFADFMGRNPEKQTHQFEAVERFPVGTSFAARVTTLDKDSHGVNHFRGSRDPSADDIKASAAEAKDTLHYHPGADITDEAFITQFEAYVIKDGYVLREFDKHRELRAKECAVIPAIANRIASSTYDATARVISHAKIQAALAVGDQIHEFGNENLSAPDINSKLDEIATSTPIQVELPTPRGENRQQVNLSALKILSIQRRSGARADDPMASAAASAVVPDKSSKKAKKKKKEESVDADSAESKIDGVDKSDTLQYAGKTKTAELLIKHLGIKAPAKDDRVTDITSDQPDKSIFNLAICKFNKKS